MTSFILSTTSNFKRNLASLSDPCPMHTPPSIPALPCHPLVPELGTRSFFQGSLSAQFLSMDRYRSIAHFADFQVRSLLNHSQKDQWFALGKER